MMFDSRTPTAAYGSRGLTIQGSAIDASMSVLARAEGSVISFAMGSPAPDAMPRREIADAIADLLRSTNGSDALDYAPTEGHPRLRSALLARLDRLGSPIDPDSLLVTAGGMQGIDLVCRLFLDPGDVVLAESPSYANGLATLHNNGATIVQIPLNAGGMDLRAAAEAISSADRPPKLIYAIPTFQNPSGLTYSLERRQGLLDLAISTGALIVEDDPYSELHYEADVPPSLLRLDAGRGNVIGVHTFSKILAPGLRVGWVIAPTDTVRRMISARHSMDTCANTLGQHVVAQMIENGGLEEHVARLRVLYPRRRDVMIAELEAQLGDLDGLSWTKPSGGMFIWLDLPSHVDGSDVLQIALDSGVAVVPGAAFDPVRCQSAIRLCYSAQDESAIREGVGRLAGAIRSVAGRDVAASV